MSTELLVFDCDGVLVDSEVIVIDIEADLLTAAGFPVSTNVLADLTVPSCVASSDLDRMMA